MKHRSKRPKKITDAVIRGKKNAYDFEVFPIETELEPLPAVYVISRRKIDKQGRGHHKFVCIGQAESLAKDISKHKKKCASRLKANVICVFAEEKENHRLKIEADLKSAHAIPCQHQ